MLITDVRAHHIRIPYDAGVASFKQGASAIAAVEIVLIEVSTDAGLTGWGDAFAYVCPRTTATAVEEMIAPRARDVEVPDPAGIPAFMERIQRNLHLFGRYGITMFAISGLDIALWDLAARVLGEPLHRLLGTARRARIPAYAACSGSGILRRWRRNAMPPGGRDIRPSSCTRRRSLPCSRLVGRSARASR
jgi:L-alanine-DL-glutamate epimerase-like enolase superfamily enzyme